MWFNNIVNQLAEVQPINRDLHRLFVIDHTYPKTFFELVKHQIYKQYPKLKTVALDHIIIAFEKYEINIKELKRLLKELNDA